MVLHPRVLPRFRPRGRLRPIMTASPFRINTGSLPYSGREVRNHVLGTREGCCRLHRRQLQPLTDCSPWALSEVGSLMHPDRCTSRRGRSRDGVPLRVSDFFRVFPFRLWRCQGAHPLSSILRESSASRLLFILDRLRKAFEGFPIGTLGSHAEPSSPLPPLPRQVPHRLASRLLPLQDRLLLLGPFSGRLSPLPRPPARLRCWLSPRRPSSEQPRRPSSRRRLP